MKNPRIIIIGAGFAGIGLGIRLLRQGFGNFTLLEKAGGIGGTWYSNTYPGCACDVPAFAYSYSFELNPRWSQKWVPQQEILQYLEHCVAKYGLRSRISLNTEVHGARWDGPTRQWCVSTRHGDMYADVLVSAVGQLSRPSVPDLPGLASFQGPSWHSAEWNHDADLAGQDVAVIGNAASAIQLVPELARVARRVSVFQRSANWFYPRGNRRWHPIETALFCWLPGWARLYRWWLWLSLESRWLAFRPGSRAAKLMDWLCRRHLHKSVPDDAARAKMTPDYPVGAKRILLSDDWFAALERDNVRLVTDPIAAVEAEGLRTQDGALHPADVLVFATGFRTTEFLTPMQVTAPDGVTLEEKWRDGARAHLGITVDGFPNFFVMYGPNTNLGHHSIIFMGECQARYITSCLAQMRERGLRQIAVKPGRVEAFDAEMQERLQQTPWAQVERSWYMNSSGRITNNWPGPTVEYWWRTRRVQPADFSLRP